LTLEKHHGMRDMRLCGLGVGGSSDRFHQVMDIDQLEKWHPTQWSRKSA
jgi:hypothetical protein